MKPAETATPETDAFIESNLDSWKEAPWKDFARNLERQRDAWKYNEAIARDNCAALADQLSVAKGERDEALNLNDVHWGQILKLREDRDTAIAAANKLREAFVEVCEEFAFLLSKTTVTDPGEDYSDQHPSLRRAREALYESPGTIIGGEEKGTK